VTGESGLKMIKKSKEEALNFSFFVDEFVLGANIGEGAFGEVNLCWPKDQRPDLPPIMSIRKLPIDQGIHTMLIDNELRVYEHIKHPHITDKLQIFQDKQHYYMLQEHSLGGHIRN